MSQVVYHKMKTTKVRLAVARANESSALKVVQSQKAMLEMVQRNMESALSQLEKCRHGVKEISKTLSESEEKFEIFLRIEGKSTESARCKNESPSGGLKLGESVPITICVSVDAEAPDHLDKENKDDERSDADSPFTSNLQEVPHEAATDVKLSSCTGRISPSPRQANDRLPLTRTTREVDSSRSRQAAVAMMRPKESEQHLVSKLRNLSSGSKMILREIILSAVLHPKGEVDPDMLSKLTSKEAGLTNRAIFNAVNVAKMRHKSRIGRDAMTRCRK